MTTLTLFDKALREAVAHTAHGIRATGLCKVSGRHLSEAPNTALEPGDLTEEDLLAIDKEFAADRYNGSLQQSEDQRALQQQCDAQVRSEWRAR